MSSDAIEKVEHSEHNTPYFTIFFALLIFTVITVLASFRDLHSKAANVALALTVSPGFKAGRW